MHQLKRTQTLPITLQQAWDFFSSPKNLATITPDSLNFTILSELPEEMYPGMFIQYTVSPVLRVPLRWVTEITHVRNLEYFVDEQRLGPYRIWHHQHFFKQVEGGVEMIDLVDYRLPLGIFGKLANALFVKRQLKAIFDYREVKLVELFGTTN